MVITDHCVNAVIAGKYWEAFNVILTVLIQYGNSNMYKVY